MNLDFMKDLVSLNPIKASYVSNNLRVNFGFIVDDHVRDKEMGERGKTLLEKLQTIMVMFLNDELDKDTLYALLGHRLDLTQYQFDYLFGKIKQDLYIIDLIFKIVAAVDESNENTVKRRLGHIMDDQGGFANVSVFLIRECNNAAKIR